MYGRWECLLQLERLNAWETAVSAIGQIWTVATLRLGVDELVELRDGIEARLMIHLNLVLMELSGWRQWQ